jgi:carboxymethylenebutenolidase
LGGWHELRETDRRDDSDEQAIGDGRAAAAYLRGLPYANGRVGTIGFCMGGRLAYVAACQIEGLDAAVDCWGGRVIASPEDLNERRPVNPIDMTPRMGFPLLGIFGNDDANPDVEQVNRTEAELTRLGKSNQFHRYDGAGHGFFATDRANYRQAQAVDGWQKVWGFFEKHLRSAT